MLTPEQIASATGASVANVRTHWPNLVRELQRVGADSVNSLVGAAGTVAVETGSFAPVSEHPSAANDNFQGYEPGTTRGRSLGNTIAGDGAKFKGRGFVQLTGRNNYADYGRRLGVNLLGQPELANDPQTAARIFALYWSSKGIHRVADSQNWREVRRLVNGGTNGLDSFVAFVGALLPKFGSDATAVSLPLVTTGPNVTSSGGASKAVVIGGSVAALLLAAGVVALLLGGKKG